MVKTLVLDMLKKDAESQKAKALLTLELLTEFPVGIGDHSTKDFYQNADEALTMLVDADDKLEALKKYFNVE
jgi:hypothetical protein